MGLESCARRRGRRLAVLALFAGAATTGCGALVTGGAIGGILAGSGGHSGSAFPSPAPANQPSKISSVAIPAGPLSGPASVSFAVSDAESDATVVTVRLTTDLNDDPTKAFDTPAVGSFARAATGVVVAGTSLPTAPGAGVGYAFVWDTAHDLPAKLSSTVRLQFILDGAVAFTTQPFTVDNTGLPRITNVSLGSLPANATAYADDQTGGAIPVNLTVAQDQGNPVVLSVLYSTDGGKTFPQTNVALGSLVDGSGNSVKLNQVPASPGGTAYVFHFASGQTGLGTSQRGGQSIALQLTAFEAADQSKVGAPVTTGAFSIDNVGSSAAIFTPSASQVTGFVVVDYLVSDALSEPVDVAFEFSVDAGQSFFPAHPLGGLPAVFNTTAVSTTPNGQPGHAFFWNAPLDMLALAPPVPASTLVTLRMTATKQATRIPSPSVQTQNFSVDQRLIFTVMGAKAAVDGVPGTATTLDHTRGDVTGLATSPLGVFFGQQSIDRVQVLGAATGLVGTALGSGSTTSTPSGSPPTETSFPLNQIGDLAVQPPGGSTLAGALFVVASAGPTSVPGSWGVFRIDQATPVVDPVYGNGAGPLPVGPYSAIAYDAVPDSIYFATSSQAIGFPGRSVADTVFSAPSRGGAVTQLTAVNVASVTSLSGQGATCALGDFTFRPMRLAAGGAAAGYGGVVFATESDAALPQGRILALNTTAGAVNVLGQSVPGGSATVLVAFTPDLDEPNGLAILDDGSILACSTANSWILRYATLPSAPALPQGPTSPRVVAGDPTGAHFAGFSGDGGLAEGGPAPALIANPSFVVPDLRNPGGFLFCDSGNDRVRACAPTGTGAFTITTIVGVDQGYGDGGLAAVAALDAPTSVASYGNTLVVCDKLNNRLRTIDVTTATISAYAGDGTTAVTGDNGAAGSPGAGVGLPSGLVIDPNGNVFVSQPKFGVVREIYGLGAGSGLTSVLPTSNGTLNAAATLGAVPGQLLDEPGALGFAGSSVLLICQADANTGVGELDALNVGSVTTSCCGVPVAVGQIVRLAGMRGSAAVPSPGAVAAVASFATPAGVAADTHGHVYLADASAGVVYELSPGTGANAGEAVVTRQKSTGGSCSGLLVSLDGNLVFVMDPEQNAIFAWNISAGTVQAYAQSIPPDGLVPVAGVPGKSGKAGDDGPATLALLQLAKAPFKISANASPGRDLAIDALGRLVFADTNNGSLRAVYPNGVIETICGLNALDGDGGSATTARLTRPTALAVRPTDNAFAVVDLGRVRLVPRTTDLVGVVAGSAVDGRFGDGARALTASLDYDLLALIAAPGTGPTVTSATDFGGARALAFSTGVPATPLVAIADTRNHAVRLVNLGSSPYSVGTFSVAPGDVATVAGSVDGAGLPVVETVPGTGDGSPVGTNGIALDSPEGVVFLSNGMLLVSDTREGAIRALNLDSTSHQIGGQFPVPSVVTVGAGQIETVCYVGSVTEPRSLAYDPAHELCIAAVGSSANASAAVVVWNVSPTTTTTAFGHSLPPGEMQRLGGLRSIDTARGVAVDPTTSNAVVCVRNLDIVVDLDFATGTASIVAGQAGIPTGATNGLGDGGIPSSATLRSPEGVAVDSFGSIYVLDSGNSRVRRFRRFP